MRIALQRASVQRDPNLVWNTFINIIATGDPLQLTLVQHRVRLVFDYESEVQNGGHGQYFENKCIEVIPATIEALNWMGLVGQAAVLAQAHQRLVKMPRDCSWEEWLVDNEIEEWDATFHDCQPDIMDIFACHLARHEAEYIELI